MLSILVATPGLARDARAFQRAMNGIWNGNGLALNIDTERLQANVDPEKPFDWRPFRIVDVTGNLIVFDIGRSRFIALVNADASAMTLTIRGEAGERLLQHLRR